MLEASELVSQNSDAAKSAVERTIREFIRLSGEDYIEKKGLSTSASPNDPIVPAAAWLCIRMTTPTREYTSIPRWHRDGRMFDSDHEGDINWKYATTLLGNPTRLLTESELVKRVMSERGHNRRRLEYAKELASEPLLDVRNGQIIRFTWGQGDSPVHSEPDMSTHRVFISILFGSEKEMRNMCEFRKETYRE